AASAQDALSRLAYTGVNITVYNYDDCYFCYYGMYYTVDVPWPARFDDHSDVVFFGAQPTWSPAGTQIAFAREGNIFVKSITSNEIQLTDSANNAQPAWSPDGLWIAFVTSRTGAPEIYLINPEGSVVVPLTRRNAANVSRPVWSPDGSRIIFNCMVERF